MIITLYLTKSVLLRQTSQVSGTRTETSQVSKTCEVSEQGFSRRIFLSDWKGKEGLVYNTGHIV